jgi:hypothetical protein
MTWRIWSPVGRCSSSNASFEISLSSDGTSALDEKRRFAGKAPGDVDEGLLGRLLARPGGSRGQIALDPAVRHQPDQCDGDVDR